MHMTAFSGQDRFVPRALLGSGEFGTVFEVWDRTRGEVVAAKVLHRVEPGALARFKVEFRALADMRHPNLVRGMELHGAPDGTWFFTMTLLQGTDPLAWLQRQSDAPPALTIDAVSLPETTGEARSPSPGSAFTPAAGRRVDRTALTDVFAQLVAGVGALHDAGFLHRDLKPSNVMVSPEGAVTILDFGVARALDDDRSQFSTAGTPRYMAPERWRGQPHGEASDWYAVGVMLHEALYGAPPAGFDGRFPALPDCGMPDLTGLCARLLAPDPVDRPSRAELEAAFALGPAAVRNAPTNLFVGRTTERERLVAGWRETRAGLRRTVLVLGPSGVGKSTLVRRALRDMAADGALVALTGRCLEHETLPFKAVDGVIDALARHLGTLSEDAVGAILPRHTSELAQVFPTLTAVQAVASWPSRHLVDEPVEVRRRAFRALADLLGALHDRTPVVLFIDDLQWGDEASARLLIDVLSGLDAPGVLFVGACRTDERAESPFLRVWDAWTAQEPVRHSEIAVGALSPDECVTLCRHLVGDEARARSIADDAVGSPMLVEELVRAGQSAEHAGLAQVIRHRLDALSPAHAAVLEAVATAQRPLLREVLWDATGLGDAAWPVVDDLVGERLLRRRQIGGRLAFEVRHDRYREAVTSRIQQGAGLQRALGDAGARHDVAADWIAARYELAGDMALALPYATRAAEEAVASLALERAAELYAQALRCALPDARTGLMVARADALALIGRSTEASELYLEAAATSPDPLALRYKASIQQICCGRNEQGVVGLRAVSEAVGVGWPTRPWTAVAGLMWTSFRLLGWRTPRPAQRPALVGPARSALSPAALCWEACQALSSSDWIRGAWFAAQGADFALRSGDPVRIGRAMAWLSAQVEPFSRRQCERALQLAKEIAETHPDPELLAVIDLVSATRWLTSGRFAPAVPLFDRAVDRLERECTGTAYLGMIARSLQGETFIHMGDLPRLRVMVGAAQHRYWELGNAHGNQVVRLQQAMVHMADDQPGRARTLLDLVDRDNPKDGFFYLHYGQMENSARLSLYEGDLDGAIAGLEARWPRMMASGIVWVPSVACRAWSVRGNLHAAKLVATGDAAARARVMEALAKLARARVPQAEAEHRQLSAALARADGRMDDAARLSAEAGARFAANSQHLRGAIATRAAGGAGWEAVFRERVIAAPDRWAKAFAPAL